MLSQHPAIGTTPVNESADIPEADWRSKLLDRMVCWNPMRLSASRNVFSERQKR